MSSASKRRWNHRHRWSQADRSSAHGRPLRLALKSEQAWIDQVLEEFPDITVQLLRAIPSPFQSSRLASAPVQQGLGRDRRPRPWDLYGVPRIKPPSLPEDDSNDVV